MRESIATRIPVPGSSQTGLYRQIPCILDPVEYDFDVHSAIHKTVFADINILTKRRPASLAALEPEAEVLFICKSPTSSAEETL